MATILLVIIYAVFIGLGLPDSLFGSAWPAIYAEFSLPISYANFITFTISSGTVCASLFAAKLINKFGTGPVTAISSALTAVMILGFSIAPSIWIMLALSLPLGLGAGAIDSALNNYVATHYSSVQMNFLHCFYGVGVAASPLFMSLALSVKNDWRSGYFIVFTFLAVIALLSIIALPLWKKVQNKEHASADGEKFEPRTLTLKQMAKIPAVRYAWIAFFCSVGLEFTCGTWGTTFFVKAEGLTEAEAAKFLTFYYVGITTGRFVSGLVSKRMQPKHIVYSGYSLVFVAIVTLCLPVPAVVKGCALFLIGFGNGPTFPNLIYLTPINFGKDVSQSIVSTQMAACNIGVLTIPPLFGFVADYLSIKLFAPFIGVLFVLMTIFTVSYLKKIAKTKKGMYNSL